MNMWNTTRRLLAGWLLALAAGWGCRAAPDTPLTTAATRGDAPRIRALLAEGVDPDDRDGRGWTALQWASRSGQTGAVAALLEGGAGPDVRDHGPNGWTALMHAIHRGRTDAAIALMRAGADVNARSGGGVTPLMMAAGYGHIEIVRALLENGADPYARTGSGVNALWYAAGGGALADVTDGPSPGTCHPRVARALLGGAPDLTIPRDAWTDPLIWLADEECATLIKSLRER